MSKSKIVLAAFAVVSTLTAAKVSHANPAPRPADMSKEDFQGQARGSSGYKTETNRLKTGDGDTKAGTGTIPPDGTLTFYGVQRELGEFVYDSNLARGTKNSDPPAGSKVRLKGVTPSLYISQLFHDNRYRNADGTVRADALGLNKLFAQESRALCQSLEAMTSALENGGPRTVAARATWLADCLTRVGQLGVPADATTVTGKCDVEVTLPPTPAVPIPVTVTVKLNFAGSWQVGYSSTAAYTALAAPPGAADGGGFMVSHRRDRSSSIECSLDVSVSTDARIPVGVGVGIGAALGVFENKYYVCANKPAPKDPPS